MGAAYASMDADAPTAGSASVCVHLTRAWRRAAATAVLPPLLPMWHRHAVPRPLVCVCSRWARWVSCSGRVSVPDTCNKFDCWCMCGTSATARVARA